MRLSERMGLVSAKKPTPPLNRTAQITHEGVMKLFLVDNRVAGTYVEESQLPVVHPGGMFPNILKGGQAEIRVALL